MADKTRIPDRPAKGAALWILLAMLGLGAMALFMSGLNAHQVSQARQRDQLTVNTLALAKDALIGSAASEMNSPGTLPCPDVDGDGVSDWQFGGSNVCKSDIGLLPWHTLNLEPLSDGSGECLWYVLSPSFRNTIPTAFRGSSQPSINPGTAGELTVYGSDGSAPSPQVNPIIALVIAPGRLLQGQARNGPTTSSCPNSPSAANYLDTGPAPASINNATGSQNGKTFVAAQSSDTFNDVVVEVTQDELFRIVTRRVLAELRGSATQGLLGYLADNGVYSTTGMTAGTNGYAGFVPVDDLKFPTSNPQTIDWLKKNAWTSLVTYAVTLDQQTMTIGLNGISITCVLTTCH